MWRRLVTVVTGTAAAVAVFCAGVLYAEVSIDRTAAMSTTQRRDPAPAPALPTPVVTVTAQAPGTLPEVAQPAGAARGAAPVQISVPELQIDQRLVGLRVQPDGELQVPQSYDDVGWWSTGPVPGDPGAAVMVGHVDSNDGPAVFYGLSALQEGATISVRGAGGSTVEFAVTEVQSFPKDDFPDDLVYRTEGEPSLHLVTCGGGYDPSTGEYHDNVVVFADLLEPEEEGGR